MITIQYGNNQFQNLSEVRENVENKQVFVTIKEIVQENLNIGENLLIKQDENILLEKNIRNISVIKDYLAGQTTIMFQY
ncbi:hypothetical protein X275_01395 [Marinitoga sp. 1197]|uniref:hypothetical protein n=1 Tax=unclassified Marinitoga TaxID=2640159 RepID=UPI000640DD81|nr:MULTISPECIES: hypothetical protein [unclassified Marinitoga]AJW76926.1 hypothetical protein UF08_37 [Marinitoga camini virus 1]AJW77006.1 hypothetical protein UF09_40 [Marinitoga camini virus 2]KLO24070.1 hypothetical protein X275_01395 [Marinitoga sp. 1197]KLO24825.1 hypothetical protein X274_02470 [Marinitoga sp. 1155]